MKNKADKSSSYKRVASEEKLHPLELKYGKEPKIQPTEEWSWH
ncbi:MAG: hypothetical protein ACXACP_03910 [Candidatus Hodarchaeales archaeon]